MSQDLAEYQKKSQLQQQEEVGLRTQLSMYTDKYDDFQKALTTSNRTFVGFKDQMDTMTKKLKNLEKETATWKQRWEKSNTTLLDMATEKKHRDAELSNVTKQLAQLEKLCRALQTERTSLITQLKPKPVVDQIPLKEQEKTEQIEEEPVEKPAESQDQVLTGADSSSDPVPSLVVDQQLTSEPLKSIESASGSGTVSADEPAISANQETCPDECV